MFIEINIYIFLILGWNSDFARIASKVTKKITTKLQLEPDVLEPVKEEHVTNFSKSAEIIVSMRSALCEYHIKVSSITMERILINMYKQKLLDAIHHRHGARG